MRAKKERTTTTTTSSEEEAKAVRRIKRIAFIHKLRWGLI